MIRPPIGDRILDAVTIALTYATAAVLGAWLYTLIYLPGVCHALTH